MNAIQTTGMKPSQITESIEAAYLAKRPLFIWGGPGTAKSSLVAQFCAEKKIGFIDVRLCLMDAVDFGFPYTEKTGKTTKTFWSTPAWLPTKGEGVIFFDEFPQSATMVMNTSSQLILDGKLRDYYTLPGGWRFVAAGNRDKDRAATNRIPSHIANRFIHVEIVPDLDDWIAWALKNDIATEVMFFLKYRPDAMYEFDPTRNEKAYPTLRSWHMVSDIVKTKPGKSIVRDLICGTVGEGRGSEFHGFLSIFGKLPSPDAIVNSPDTAEIPKDPSVMAALCAAIARKASLNTFDRIVKYAKRIDAEFGTLLIEFCRAKDPEVIKTRSYIEWESANAKFRQ